MSLHNGRVEGVEVDKLGQKQNVLLMQNIHMLGRQLTDIAGKARSQKKTYSLSLPIAEPRRMYVCTGVSHYSSESETVWKA